MLPPPHCSRQLLLCTLGKQLSKSCRLFVPHRVLRLVCNAQVSRVFQPACRQALKRVFRLCDADGDGALSDAELNQFQARRVSPWASCDLQRMATMWTRRRARRESFWQRARTDVLSSARCVLSPVCAAPGAAPLLFGAAVRGRDGRREAGRQREARQRRRARAACLAEHSRHLLSSS